jgi:hypothetical protein
MRNEVIATCITAMLQNLVSTLGWVPVYLQWDLPCLFSGYSSELRHITVRNWRNLSFLFDAVKLTKRRRYVTRDSTAFKRRSLFRAVSWRHIARQWRVWHARSRVTAVNTAASQDLQMAAVRSPTTPLPSYRFTPCYKPRGQRRYLHCRENDTSHKL